MEKEIEIHSPTNVSKDKPPTKGKVKPVSKL